MTTTLGQTVFPPMLTPVRFSAFTDVAGTYYNGPNNNGVGATLTINSETFSPDNVLVNVDDRVLLASQTNFNEQGIYIVLSIGSTVVLQRAFDQQSLEQIKGGMCVSVAAGQNNIGQINVIIEPLPMRLGIDNFNWINS